MKFFAGLGEGDAPGGEDGGGQEGGEGGSQSHEDSFQLRELFRVNRALTATEVIRSRPNTTDTNSS